MIWLTFIFPSKLWLYILSGPLAHDPGIPDAEQSRFLFLFPKFEYLCRVLSTQGHGRQRCARPLMNAVLGTPEITNWYFGSPFSSAQKTASFADVIFIKFNHIATFAPLYTNGFLKSITGSATSFILYFLTKAVALASTSASALAFASASILASASALALAASTLALASASALAFAFRLLLYSAGH